MSEHFSRIELTRSQMALKLKISNILPLHLEKNLDATLAGLERMRAYLGKPVIILSGYRSPELNDAVGGSKSSQHMLAQAVDFKCPDFGDPLEIAHALSKAMRILGIDQLILEDTWVHVSFTNEPRYMVMRYVGPGKYSNGLG